MSAGLIDLTGKAALVTGGARGLGLDIVRALAAAGAAVMIMDFREAVAVKAKAELNAEGLPVDMVLGDVRMAADANRAVAATVDAFGSIDILVNNAAVFSVIRTDRLTEDEWNRVIDIGLKGTHLMCQAAMRAMLDRPDAPCRIVNIASVGGIAPVVADGLMVHYNAAKAGVISYTRTLAKELMSSGIRVNCVAPGQMGMTPGNQEVLVDATPEQTEKFVAVSTAGAQTSTEEVARMVLALASPLADGMRGQTVVVDGGLLLMP
ncbi:SDR family NAD(P)-dependent oxidoreductase [Streptomyces sp. GQFP]|uniref:SDR family NAD(P)-dependent oxidoreductase n=1 Tax=Streptomyces sp. GQFP TaxID=2907545 RepID=UPI001F3E2038|nr:SDR family NAD(P)-dependent oxidoreductase [Streptomyces sp. GQFP]UIX29298.1 SDR family oxidoreductase [Streptomyces sp. GQFP]